MIEKQKTVYYCEHCKKSYLSKHFGEKHELNCSENPINKRPCLSMCSHLCKKELRVWYETGYSEGFRTVGVFFCNKLNKAVYPPKVENKGNNFEFFEDFNGNEIANDPMPIACDYHKDSSIHPMDKDFDGLNLF